MQRNTSFFWASDDLRNAGGDSGDGGVDRNSGQSPGVGLSWSVDEADEHELDSSTSDGGVEQGMAVSTPERLPLRDNINGYGSANDPESGPFAADGGRRQLFEQPEIRAKEQHCNQRNQRVIAKPIYAPRYPEKPRADTKSIRFQVVIWHIGTINVQTGHVKMRFRLTLFWNDDGNTTQSTVGSKGAAPSNPDAGDVWKRDGRQKAYRKIWNINQEESAVQEMIDVPPVSILNAVELEVVDDAPDIIMVDRTTRAMRWTCMYNATLFQGDHMSVKDFPHDVHHIKIKVGILAHRGGGHRWDRNVYQLQLAEEADSQGSTRVPYGLVVDHCHVPDFGFDPADLRFQFFPLNFGQKDSLMGPMEKRDMFLQVTLPVYRQSGHYDTSILPTLVMLNIIAITCLTRNFESASAATEIMLSIAFVQVGIRLTLDSRLPSVGYPIKVQKVMNCCFWLLSGLVLESNVVFFLVKKWGWTIEETDRIDLAVACVAFTYNLYIIAIYFNGRRAESVYKGDLMGSLSSVLD